MVWNLEYLGSENTVLRIPFRKYFSNIAKYSLIYKSPPIKIVDGISPSTILNHFYPIVLLFTF
jgi:hypothetical protein